ncbi:hypothetical protein P7E15_02790 [Enterococcus gallinarum]|nr:hypothetical protein [Enterococcus gallinarum]
MAAVGAVSSSSEFVSIGSEISVDETVMKVLLVSVVVVERVECSSE